MAEYIDLDTPLELYVDRGGFYRQQITTLRELLDVNHLRYEIADVRPVVRGEWIPTGETAEIYGDVYRCSACGVCDIGELDVCPNCGADMRMEAE